MPAPGAEGGCASAWSPRRREQLEDLAARIAADGGKAAWAVADVADRAQVAEAMRGLEGALGPIDLMVANAGVGVPTILEPRMNTEVVEHMFRVNVFGVLYCIEAVLPGMLARKRGHLAAVSSLGAYKGLPGESGYTASKAAVNNLMEGFRIQLRGKGIDVTTICPGFIKTEMTAKNNFAMPYLMEASEAARRIVRALERRAAVYDFPWQMRLLMWLTGWLPDGMVERAMSRYNEDPPMPSGPL